MPWPRRTNLTFRRVVVILCSFSAFAMVVLCSTGGPKALMSRGAYRMQRRLDRHRLIHKGTRRIKPKQSHPARFTSEVRMSSLKPGQAGSTDSADQIDGKGGGGRSQPWDAAQEAYKRATAAAKELSGERHSWGRASGKSEEIEAERLDWERQIKDRSTNIATATGQPGSKSTSKVRNPEVGRTAVGADDAARGGRMPEVEHGGEQKPSTQGVEGDVGSGKGAQGVEGLKDDSVNLAADIQKVALWAANRMQSSALAHQKRRMDASPEIYASTPYSGSSVVQKDTSIPQKKTPKHSSFQISLGSQMMSIDALWKVRRSKVKLAVQEAWAVYEKYAFGYDELVPLSLRGVNNMGGTSGMIVDSIDTLYMLGLHDEFLRAAGWIANDLTFVHEAHLYVPEVIRKVIGGLLGIYELTGDTVFLEKASTIMAKVLKAFEGGVFPARVTGLTSGNVSEEALPSILGEFGGLQMELWTLSKRAGVQELASLAEFPIWYLDQTNPGKGLLPVYFNRKSGQPDESMYANNTTLEYTMGELAAPYYENLLKMWLLTGKQEEMYKRMWQKAMDQALELLFCATLEGEVMIGRRQGGRVQAIMEHATCAMPGMLALGALQNAVDATKLWFYMDNASKLMETCWRMYERTATGLAPQEFHINHGNISIVESNDLSNSLHPAAAKSLVFMWRATKDPKFRAMGWSIFQAFMQHSRTPEGAFAAVKHVNQLPPVLEDRMPTHVTSQTLKYLWLLFGPDDAFASDWVFSFGGHPFRVSGATNKSTTQ